MNVASTEQPARAAAASTAPIIQPSRRASGTSSSFDKVRHLESTGRDGQNTISFAWELRSHPGVDLGLQRRSKSKPKAKSSLPPRKPRRKSDAGKTKEEKAQEEQAAQDEIEIAKLEKIKQEVLRQQAELQAEKDGYDAQSIELNQQLKEVEKNEAERAKVLEKMQDKASELNKDINHFNDSIAQETVSIAKIRKQLAAISAELGGKSTKNARAKFKEVDLGALTFGPTDEVSAVFALHASITEAPVCLRSRTFRTSSYSLRASSFLNSRHSRSLRHATLE